MGDTWKHANNPPQRATTAVLTLRGKRLRLLDLTKNSAIEFWGGVGIEKIVYSPCPEGEINSFYCFFPTDKADQATEGLKRRATTEELLEKVPDLDPRLLALFSNVRDMGPWRLFVHEPYERWTTGRTCILGDASEAAPERQRRVDEQGCLVPGRAVSSMPEVVVRM